MNYAKDIARDYTASYAAYVATSRAIPSLVDGLKPVNRRCVNSADDLKLYHDKKFLKVAKLEGQVMGDYHPHGGASPVILAQPFKTRYPLFEGQGNFGSPDEPNSVAASRYIECRLTKFCEDFYLSSADYADRQPNYDGRIQEITRYYPPIPGVLLTGSSGIAVGLSTNIPPHTVTSVGESLLAYIKDPTSDKYISLISPETCEESIILTPKKDIEKLYRTGEGSIQYKAKTHYESLEGKLALVVDAFPPDYRKKSLETSYILEAVESGALELRNESKEGIRYVFLSNSKDILQNVEERLTSSSGYRMYIEHDGKIKCYNLSDLYSDFLASRQVYIERKYSDLLRINMREKDYLSILVRVKVEREYLKTLLDMTSEESLRDLQKKFDISKEIAVRIINTSLRSLMNDNIEIIKKQIADLEHKIEEYRKYAENPMEKIIIDIKDLLKDYKTEKKRAIHLEDIEDSIAIAYHGETISAHPSSVFYVAAQDNKYEQVHAAEFANMDLTDKFIVSADYDYYVLYDDQGLVAVTREIMERDNKFKSEKLSGIIGTNDLTKINMYRSTNKRVIPLGEWALRTRASYVRQVDTGTISLVAQP